jgi:NAD(P)-dependent dehydrogenase (short-subunit alcohol dehydrogenase family)
MTWAPSQGRFRASLSAKKGSQESEMSESLVTVVTGAGSGLGLALARRQAAQGRQVVLVGRRKERLAGARQACMEAGGTEEGILTVPADVTEPTAAERIINETLCAYGRIDALVNNAAVARFAPLQTADLSDVDRMVATHLIAPVALIREALPALRRARGVVVNVGSIGGLLALPGRALYGASKAALHHLTRSLARELAPEVRVNAVVPGAIDTEMYSDLGLPPAEVAALRADLIRTTPMGRMGTPDDVVPWIDLMIGPAGRWMTGSLVVVDGGRAC